MEYQWKHVEDFLKRLGFLAEARKLTAENTDLSKDQLVEAISETLEPNNLKKLIGNSDLISTDKHAKPERNYRLILDRFGIGYSGNNSFKELSNRFGISQSRVGDIVRRFEFFVFPMERVPYFSYLMGFPEFRKVFDDSLKNAKRMQRTYVNPIKSGIYYRCLDKVCNDSTDI